MHNLNKKWLPSALLVSLALAGCDNSTFKASPAPQPPVLADNSATVTKSTTGTVAAVVGGGAQTVSVTFNASDTNALSNLSITTGLSALPLGWTGPSVFTCATVTTGSGCVLNLSFTPNAIASGTVQLNYQYVNHAGTTKIGTVNIPFAATTTNNVVATAAPSGQIQAIAGSGTQSLQLTFTTDDGNPAHDLLLTSSLTSLPSGWTSPASTFTCASVSTGSGCQLALTYEPSSVGDGTLVFDYSYQDNSGTAKTGSVSVPYASTSQNNLVGTASPTGQIAATVGSTQAVDITFTSDDGRTVSGVSVTSDLSALPTGWSASSPSFTCATASTGNACQLHLTYSPSAIDSGTLTLNYAYTDNSSGAKTGTLNVSYAGTVDNNVVGAVSPSGQVIVPISGSRTVSITFESDDGNATTAFGITSDLGALPSGWSGPASFTCANVTTGNACQLDLTYTPTVEATGTLTLNYSYTNQAGVAKTGSVNVSYVGDQQHAFFAASDEIVACPILSDGELDSCAVAGTPAVVNYATTVNGDRLYVVDQATGALVFCDIQSNTLLANCTGASGGSGFDNTHWISIDGAMLYAATVDGIIECDLANDGTVNGCSPSWTGNTGSMIVTANYAYLSLTNSNQVLACELNVNRRIGVCNVNVPGLDAPKGLAMSADGTLLYIVNAGNNTVSRCAVSPVDGQLSGCTQYNTGLPDIYGIALNGQSAYISSPSAAYPLRCSVASDGSLSSCSSTASSGAAYSNFQLVIH